MSDLPSQKFANVVSECGSLQKAIGVTILTGLFLLINWGLRIIYDRLTTLCKTIVKRSSKKIEDFPQREMIEESFYFEEESEVEDDPNYVIMNVVNGSNIIQ